MGHYSSSGDGPGRPVAVPRPQVQVENYDRMGRDVTIEVHRGEESVAVEQAVLHRGDARSWHEVVDVTGEYRVTVDLRYGPSQTTAWTVETPRSAQLDVHLSPEGVDVRRRPE